jgi:amidase
MSVTETSSLTESLGQQIAGSGLDASGATVAALGQALSSGALTSADLVSYYLDRIQRLDSGLHSVISVNPLAAAEAAASDAARAAGRPLGSLAGLPVLIKDNVAVRGLPATAGSPALERAESGDAFLVGLLRQAGAVVLGKANLSEWANFRSTRSSSGWSTLGGQAVNPHGRGRSPSGSSSGSGVAVAAGLAPLSVGTETDGSIMSPSAACGIVGIKPTLGLVSRAGVVPISAAQDTAGPMTRCVADAAAMLSAMAGPDPADPATAQAGRHAADYTRYLDAGALGGVRIGVWRDGSEPAGPATVAVLEAALDRLRACGAEVIDPVPLADTDKISEPELFALCCEFRHDLDAYLAALAGDHQASLTELIKFNCQYQDRVMVHFGQELFEQAAGTGGLEDPGYRPARDEASRLARAAMDSTLAGHRLDAVVALTGSPAWLTDHVLGDRDTFGTSRPCAVSGYPAITVPAGQVCGLPVGVSFMGPAWSEPVLIGLAYAFEQAPAAGASPVAPAGTAGLPASVP